MTYTENEKRKLIENVELMIDYIRREIQPYVRDRLTIDFGGVYYGCRSTESTTLLHLAVEPTRISYAEKYGWYHDFIKENENGTALDDKIFKITSNYSVMADFVLHWQELKQKLNNAISEQKKLLDSINNFEI